MAELGPWMVTARTKEHAEYLIRSRAEQRGVRLSDITASGGSGGMWQVSVVADDAEAAAAAQLGDDTGVMHFDTHRSRSTPPNAG